MSLRSLPLAERRLTTLVTLALAMLLGWGVAILLAREVKPVSRPLAAPSRSRLVAVLEGVMSVNVTPAERERFKTWVATGATREGYAQVEPIVSNACASCHSQNGQFPRITGFEDLRPIALEPAPPGLTWLITPAGLHFVGFPFLFLVAIVGYLRRTGWPHWKGLAFGCALAVGFDAAQAWLRQGQPGHPWIAAAAMAGLVLAMAAVVGVILKDLWGTEG